MSLAAHDRCMPAAPSLEWTDADVAPLAGSRERDLSQYDLPQLASLAAGLIANTTLSLFQLCDVVAEVASRPGTTRQKRERMHEFCQRVGMTDGQGKSLLRIYRNIPHDQREPLLNKEWSQVAALAERTHVKGETREERLQRIAELIPVVAQQSPTVRDTCRLINEHLEPLRIARATETAPDAELPDVGRDAADDAPVVPPARYESPFVESEPPTCAVPLGAEYTDRTARLEREVAELRAKTTGQSERIEWLENENARLEAANARLHEKAAAAADLPTAVVAIAERWRDGAALELAKHFGLEPSLASRVTDFFDSRLRQLARNGEWSIR